MRTSSKPSRLPGAFLLTFLLTGLLLPVTVSRASAEPVNLGIGAPIGEFGGAVVGDVVGAFAGGVLAALASRVFEPHGDDATIAAWAIGGFLTTGPIGSAVGAWGIGTPLLKQNGSFWGALGGSVAATAVGFFMIRAGTASVLLAPIGAVAGYNLLRASASSPTAFTNRLALPTVTYRLTSGSVSGVRTPTVGLNILALRI